MAVNVIDQTSLHGHEGGSASITVNTPTSRVVVTQQSTKCSRSYEKAELELVLVLRCLVIDDAGKLIVSNHGLLDYFYRHRESRIWQKC